MADGVVFTEEAARRTRAAVLAVEAGDVADARRGAPGRPLARPTVHFGMPTSSFSSGTTITLNPTDQDGNDLDGLDDVVCHLAPDKSSVTHAFATSDILRFARYPVLDDDDVGGVLLGVLKADAEGVSPWALQYENWLDTTDPGAGNTITLTLDTGDWRGRLGEAAVRLQVGAPADVLTLAWTRYNGADYLPFCLGANYASEYVLTQDWVIDSYGMRVQLIVDGTDGGKLKIKTYLNSTYVRTQVWVCVRTTQQRVAAGAQIV